MSTADGRPPWDENFTQARLGEEEPPAIDERPVQDVQVLASAALENLPLGHVKQ